MSFGDPWFYIVLIGVAAIFYSFLLPGRNNLSTTKNNAVNELETTLEQYMAEIEKENEELIQLVTQMKQDFSAKQMAVQEQVAELRGRFASIEQSTRQSESRLGILEAKPVNIAFTGGLESSKQEELLIENVMKQEVASSEEILIHSNPNEEAQESLHDRYSELFSMYNSGKSIDMIAKSIGIPRGEVQLILQLAKREESR
ncbi:hypothetical protein [Paenibacillus segetis]|uniref:Uncharacterized protein n=1 Tax=Paenibacillus segetis TaxID=1325360 RepID=A0ABQ1Y9K5_9BACL|nr:hypothetical protein [Paenibacillus segetis]GGH17789.1 hypothetical protein GCM10008013_13320 [Paenibacillus segetis]